MTFTPATDEFLTVEFLSFDVENHASCEYDWLKIYDGESTSADLIGKYCGTDSPGTISATNSSGALTFQFHSDNNVNESGWEAQISCSGGMLPPDADFEASQTNIVEGESVGFTDMSANSPTSWNWTFDGGTPAISNQQNPTVTYDEPGEYDVELVVTNEAGNDTEVKEGYISVGVNTTIEVGIQSEDFTIFPNPNRSGRMNIESPYKLIKIEVTDVTGKVLKSVNAGKNHYQLNVPGLEKGMYILRLHSEKGIASRKIQMIR